jgi:hypothetical protein
LHRGLSKAPASLMRPRLIVFVDPHVQVGLQLVDRTVHLFAERDTVPALHMIDDEDLFAPFFRNPESSDAWRTILAVLFGLPTNGAKRLHQARRDQG